MIRCNLNVLLAERNLKITQVSQDTGLSRTTLTALASNKSQGVQFETINTLCNYLRVTPDNLISYIPIDIKVVDVDIWGENLIIRLKISKDSVVLDCVLCGHCYIFISDNEEPYPCDNVSDLTKSKVNAMSICVYIPDETYGEVIDPDIQKHKPILINIFNTLTTSFLNDIQNVIIEKILALFNNVPNTLKIHFGWDNELTNSTFLND